MTTFQYELPQGTPDNSGFALPALSSSLDSNKLAVRELLKLLDGGTGSIAYSFLVPQNYNASAATGPRFKLDWRGVPTTGNIRVQLSYRAVATAESMDPSTWQEALTAVDLAAEATTLNRNVDSLGTATKTNFAPGDRVLVLLERLGAHANDTMTDAAWIEGVLFEHDDS